MCSRPYRPEAGVEYGCGQCMPCRINRARLWTGRILFEASEHGERCCVVTLTYARPFLPVGGQVSTRDVQLWLKRVRVSHSGRVRFFVVGEYGDTTWRPHYHCILFGVSQVEIRRLGVQRGQGFWLASWPYGHSYIDDLSSESARYVAGYVTKKYTAEGDPKLEGRLPEFARMSLKPGIGAGYAKRIAKVVNTEVGLDYLAESGDVPTQLRALQTRWPLGRYLRRVVRHEAGFAEPGAPAGAIEKRNMEWVSQVEAAGGAREWFKKLEVKRAQHKLRAKFQSKLKPRVL